MLTPSICTFLCAAALTAGQRVMFVGDGTLSVTVAGVNDIDIGTAILHSGRDAYDAGMMAGIKLNNDPGSRTCLASGNITTNQFVRKAANGAVTVGGSGANYGIALADAQDTESVEILRLESQGNAGGSNLYIVNGTASMQAPAVINVPGVFASDRVVEAIDLTDFVVLPATLFTAGTNQITQAIYGTDLSAKKILFRLLSTGF